MKLCVTHVECYDDLLQELIFKVEAFDDTCASIEIHTVIDGASWRQIAEKVSEALALMELGGATT